MRQGGATKRYAPLCDVHLYNLQVVCAVRATGSDTLFRCYCVKVILFTLGIQIGFILFVKLFKDSCLPERSLRIISNIISNLAEGQSVLFDLGLVTLTLLAYDRFYAVQRPVEFNTAMASDKVRAWRRIGISFVLLIVAYGPQTISNIFVVQGIVMSGWSIDIVTAFTSLVRSIYLFVCLLM